jgi:hypothetical protein
MGSGIWDIRMRIHALFLTVNYSAKTDSLLQ